MAAASSSLARRAVSWRRLLLCRAFAAAAGPAKRVLVPVAAGTEPVEAATTADVLNRAGARVTVATVASAPAGDEGLLVEAAYGVKLVADGRVADLEGEAFDLIALPGGMPGSANLRDCKVLEKMVKRHAEQGGLYGAICAAPAVTLAHWGMLKGLKAACYPSFMEKFPADVIPVNSRVVVDRNAVTSQGPGTSIEFALALVEQLYGKEKMEEVAGPLYVRPQHGADYTIEELNPVKWKCSGTPQASCPLCDQGVESMSHILTGCSFSRTIWHEVLSWIRSTARPPVVEDDFVEWWKLALQATPRLLRKGTSSAIMLVAWWIWKQRNAIVFDNARPSVGALMETIKAEARSWVLVPVANGSEEMEALNLIDVLRRAGANVIVASVEDKLQTVTCRHKFNLIADMMLDEAAKMEFDLIVMPGGLPGAEKFASTEKLVDVLKKQAESNKPYGAICASPAHVLETHGLLKGKKATAFPPMTHLLTDQSHCENRVVIDGNLITSRAPGTATEFALAIVEKLFGRDKAVSLAKELVFM